MDNWESFIKQLVGTMGFVDFRVEIDTEHNHGSVFIYDSEHLIKDHVPYLIESLNHVSQLVAKKNKTNALFFDVNNYRKERERLISELARTAARKVVATKEHISLPAMNSYERRIIHVELSMHPNVATESAGTGKDRYVTIKPLDTDARGQE